MTRSIRLVLVATAALSILGAEGVSLARTTGPALSEMVQTSLPSIPAAPTSAANTSTEARLDRAKVCHIGRHPRDGVPASVHACPLVLASVAEPALSSAVRAN